MVEDKGQGQGQDKGQGQEEQKGNHLNRNLFLSLWKHLWSIKVLIQNNA
jgi:hypothetical protein